VEGRASRPSSSMGPGGDARLSTDKAFDRVTDVTEKRSSRSQFGPQLLEFLSWPSPLTACAVCGALKRCVPWSAKPG
jgi:hypothetical protein